MFNGDSLIDQLVHQQNGISSNNTTNNLLHLHAISVENLYSPTVL